MGTERNYARFYALLKKMPYADKATLVEQYTHGRTTHLHETTASEYRTMCDEMVPTFEELAEQYGDEVKFCIVNTDEQKKLRIKFAVAAYPYIVLVADGMKTPLFDELVTAERLKERIDFVLNGGKAPTTRPL